MKYLFTILISFFFACFAYASAPTIGSVTFYEGDNVNAETSKTISYTVTAGSNKMLVIGVLNICYTNITSATWNGDAMTAGTDWHATVSIGDGRWFYLANPDVGTYNAVVNFGSCSLIRIAIFELTNAVQTAPNLDLQYHPAYPTSGLVHSYTTTIDNVLVVQMVNGNSQYHYSSYGAGQTQRWITTFSDYDSDGNTKEQTTAGASSADVTPTSGCNMESFILGVGYVAPPPPAANAPDDGLIIFE